MTTGRAIQEDSESSKAISEVLLILLYGCMQYDSVYCIVYTIFY